MTSDVQSEPTLLDWWHCPDNFSIAAWQSPTVGLPLEVWHTGGVRSGVEHCASTEVACTIAMAIRARLNIVPGCVTLGELVVSSIFREILLANVISGCV